MQLEIWPSDSIKLSDEMEPPPHIQTLNEMARHSTDPFNGYRLPCNTSGSMNIPFPETPEVQCSGCGLTVRKIPKRSNNPVSHWELATLTMHILTDV